MTPAAAPPKRTRRVENPFDVRLEVRLYSTELAKLREEAKSRGLTVSDLVRSQLGDLISALPPRAPERPENGDTARTPPRSVLGPPEPPQEPTEADLAEALAAVTGQSWGYASLQIRLGKVSVKGEPWTKAKIPMKLLADLELDGEPLPIQAIESKSSRQGE